MMSYLRLLHPDAALLDLRTILRLGLRQHPTLRWGSRSNLLALASKKEWHKCQRLLWSLLVLDVKFCQCPWGRPSKGWSITLRTYDIPPLATSDFRCSGLTGLLFNFAQAYAAACHAAVMMRDELDGHDLITENEWEASSATLETAATLWGAKGDEGRGRGPQVHIGGWAQERSEGGGASAGSTKVHAHRRQGAA